MGREVNAESIRALEKQIEEGKGDIIKLKRARNSLLNISTRVPPEILGDVFAWCLVREVDRSLYSLLHFDGLQKGSHNFLLVCHHWFEVASRTPELWGFWGNSLREWEKYHRHWAGASPLDLSSEGIRGLLEETRDSGLRVSLGDATRMKRKSRGGLDLDTGRIWCPLLRLAAPDEFQGATSSSPGIRMCEHLLYKRLSR